MTITKNKNKKQVQQKETRNKNKKKKKKKRQKQQQHQQQQQQQPQPQPQHQKQQSEDPWVWGRALVAKRWSLSFVDLKTPYSSGEVPSSNHISGVNGAIWKRQTNITWFISISPSLSMCLMNLVSESPIRLLCMLMPHPYIKGWTYYQYGY